MTLYTSVVRWNKQITIAEIGPKGRYVDKDNIPTSFLEFFAPSTFESRDQRSVVPAVSSIIA